MAELTSGLITDAMVERVANALHMQAVKNGREHVGQQAHNVRYKNFNVSPIRDLINSMEATEVPLINTLPEESRLDPLPFRIKFLTRSASAVYHLLHDLAVIQAAALHRVDPQSIATGSFDDQPTNVKALLRTVVGAALRSSAPLLPPYH
jgi:hypothetical protein